MWKAAVTATVLYRLMLLHTLISLVSTRKLRSADDLENNPLTNSVEFIWSTTTVAVGDTAVLHCSFDAIFQQLRTCNIDWYREGGSGNGGSSSGSAAVRPARSVTDGTSLDATLVANGKKVTLADGRYRVYRPHNSALSVLIIRRAKKRDAGIYRCNLAGSTTRHKYMVLNVTESKIEAQTSAATQRAKIGTDVTLWCNASGYPTPVVYWTREDRNRQLPDGTYQYWGNGLQLRGVSEAETGIYSCYLDNFVQPIVSYKFSLMVEDNPWNLDGYKMRFDSKQWFPQDSVEPKPVRTKSFLLMCETREASRPLPVIRWYRDGKAVRNSRHFYIIEDSSDARSNSAASSTLVIMTFRARFKGNYTCVASNVFRMKKLTFYVQEFLEPEQVAVDDTAASHGVNRTSQSPPAAAAAAGPQLTLPAPASSHRKPPVANNNHSSSMNSLQPSHPAFNALPARLPAVFQPAAGSDAGQDQATNRRQMRTHLAASSASAAAAADVVRNRPTSSNTSASRLVPISVATTIIAPHGKQFTFKPPKTSNPLVNSAHSGRMTAEAAMTSRGQSTRHVAPQRRRSWTPTTGRPERHSSGSGRMNGSGFRESTVPADRADELVAMVKVERNGKEDLEMTGKGSGDESDYDDSESKLIVAVVWSLILYIVN